MGLPSLIGGDDGSEEGRAFGFVRVGALQVVRRVLEWGLRLGAFPVRGRQDHSCQLKKSAGAQRSAGLIGYVGF